MSIAAGPQRRDLDLEHMRALKSDYVKALRSYIQSASFVGGHREENLILAAYFDGVIRSAGSKTVDEIITGTENAS